MTLSVVIPCYNAEPYVGQTIESVLGQTRQADEVLVVDDGSTDGSVEVVRQFGNRVQLLTGRNGGASPTRNRGFEHASGDAIMFLDADDLLGATALEALAGALRPGAVAACPWFRLEVEGGVWVRSPASCPARRPGYDALAGWLTGWYHPPCSVLWSREALDVVGPWNDLSWANDDGYMMMQALARGVPLTLTDGGEAFYRRLRPTDAPSVSSRRLTSSGLEARLWVLERVAETLAEEGRLGVYRAPLDEAIERVERESREIAPEVAVRSAAVARRFSGYPWIRLRRRLGRGLRRRLGWLRPRPSVGGSTSPHSGPPQWEPLAPDA